MIYQNKQATVTFDESVPCIVWKPDGFLKGDMFKIPFAEGIAFMEKKIKVLPNLTWLNDARKLKTVSVEDVQWLNKNVNDKAIKMGVKKVAFVLPENIFGRWAIKLYVDFTNKRTDNSMEIKAFQDIEDAREWLMSKVNSPSKETSFI